MDNSRLRTQITIICIATIKNLHKKYYTDPEHLSKYNINSLLEDQGLNDSYT